VPKYEVTATSINNYVLQVEANSADEAREQVQYLSPDKWLSNGYEFTIDYVEEIN